MIRKIGLVIAITLGALGLTPVTGAGAADPILPVDSNLTVAPATVSWPSAPGFEYRLSLRSGPDGADFSFNFPHEPWGPEDVAGTPFSATEATLEGPGELKVLSIAVADLSPTACYRGGIGSPQWDYGLTMPPNSQTVVKMSSGLLAAPVAGMNRGVTAEISDSAFDRDPLVLSAPIAIEGAQDVRIVGGIPGSRPYGTTELRPGESFRITGRTEPAVKNTKISFQAEWRARSGPGGVPGETKEIATLRTDSRGRFRSDPLALRTSGLWVLTSRVKGASEESFSCNGAVEVSPKIARTSIRNLDGRQFVSTSIKGPGKKPEKVKIAFIRGKVYGKNSEVISENGPIMLADAGCNIMGAGYEVRKGRLRWNQPVSGTLVGCRDDRDSWMYSRLQRGLKAKYVGKTLILKGKRGVVIKLKFHRWFGVR